MTPPAINPDSPKAPLGPSARTSLIEARLRQTASGVQPPLDSHFSTSAFEHLMRGDAGHLHRAHDLRHQPIESHRRVIGPFVATFKRALLRPVYPLLETQSTWNGANARMVTFLLRRLAAQGRSIELLEQQVAELNEKLDR